MILGPLLMVAGVLVAYLIFTGGWARLVSGQAATSGQ